MAQTLQHYLDKIKKETNLLDYDNGSNSFVKQLANEAETLFVTHRGVTCPDLITDECYPVFDVVFSGIYLVQKAENLSVEQVLAFIDLLGCE